MQDFTAVADVLPMLINFQKDINGNYDIGCELQRKRVECAIMIKGRISGMKIIQERIRNDEEKQERSLVLILTAIITVFLCYTAGDWFWTEQELVQQRTSRLVWTWQVVSALPIRQKTDNPSCGRYVRYCI